MPLDFTFEHFILAADLPFPISIFYWAQSDVFNCQKNKKFKTKARQQLLILIGLLLPQKLHVVWLSRRIEVVRMNFLQSA